MVNRDESSHDNTNPTRRDVNRCNIMVHKYTESEI